jgi:hypothetical protein
MWSLGSTAQCWHDVDELLTPISPWRDRIPHAANAGAGVLSRAKAVNKVDAEPDRATV